MDTRINIKGWMVFDKQGDPVGVGLTPIQACQAALNATDSKLRVTVLRDRGFTCREVIIIP